MTSDIETIINESIRHELLVSDLYLVFYELFPQDSAFWWTLLVEEKHHAALIESLRISLLGIDDFPEDLIYRHVDILKQSNREVAKFIETFGIQPPSREDAFRLALSLEQSSTESLYQEVMSDRCPSEMVSMIQQINRNDKNHALRIQIYMKEKGITG